MFVGRKKELEVLYEELNKNKSSVLVYGKRKVGKTTLINEAAKKYKDKVFVYYECIKDTEEKNIESIITLLKELKILDGFTSLENKTFLNLFAYLKSLNKKMIIVIDEYPYLKEFTPSKTVDSIFQNIIDNYLDNINLIVSGSHIGMMKDLLEEKNALFGRFSKVLFLNELTYLECSEFYQNLSNYDKVAFYSVFGGSPFVNEQINANMSLKENIINLLLNKKSSVYIYASSLLISDLSNEIQANRLFSSLRNGKKSYSELEELFDKNKSGLLSKHLKPLLDMELIKKEAPINKLNDFKKYKYEINDNLLRFYYTYILPCAYLLNYKDESLIYEENINPSLNTFISFRFEDICKSFIWNHINKNKIKNVVNVGRYYYDDPITRTNGEFDLVILYKSGAVHILDAKYYNDKIKQSIVDEELEQINKIKELKVDKVGFISVNGFEDNIQNIDYRFDGDDIYNI